MKLSVPPTLEGISRCAASLHAPKVCLSFRKAHFVRKKSLLSGRQKTLFRGTGDGNRTRTGLLPRDFKSLASTCSATPAYIHYSQIIIPFLPVCVNPTDVG